MVAITGKFNSLAASVTILAPFCTTSGCVSSPKCVLLINPCNGANSFAYSTISFTVENKRPEAICRHLADHSICAWDGHFYAIRAVEAMGLMGQGGVTRMGIAVYNTPEEIDYVISVLQNLLNE